MTICKSCHRHGQSNDLVYNEESRIWACEVCGRVDEVLSNRSQYVSVSQQVGSIMDEDSRLQIRENMDRLEAKFKQESEAIFDLYLGVGSPHTSLLGSPAASLKNGAKQWFERIRELEKQQYARNHLNLRAENRRTKYLVLIAIKLAAQESAITIFQNKLQDAGIRRKKRDLPMYTKGDEKVKNPAMQDMFYRANAFPQDSFGHLDSLPYLMKLFRRYSDLINFTITPLEVMHLYVVEIINRMRFLVELPHEDRLKHLLTKPKISKGAEREWVVSDFADLEGVNWNQVLPHAFQLYQMQECVRLWNNSATPMIAIALTQWAIQSSSRMIMSQIAAFQSELASGYGRTVHVPAERFRDLRNMIIAWSTSITDAGIPFPIMSLPSKGGFGDGISGFRGDSRRPIPEMDLAVAAAPILAENWPKVLKARLRNRLAAMAIEDEIWLCRKMFVVSAQVHHYQQIASARYGRHQVIARPLLAPPIARPKAKPRASFKFRDNAEAARQAIAAFEPLKRAMSGPPQVMPWTPLGTTIHYSAIKASNPMYFTSNSGLLNSRSSPYHHGSSMQFILPPEEKSLQRMMEDPDSSSDEDDEYSSDEGETVQPKSYSSGYPPSLAQINANAQAAINNKQPFAFTIGPKGFNIDTNSRTPPTVRPINHPRPAVDSSSDLSQSPLLMSRQSSTGSSSGMGSVSEAESAIRHPHGSTSVSNMLNTPSIGTNGSTSPSPSVSLMVTSTRPVITALPGHSHTGSSRAVSSAQASLARKTSPATSSTASTHYDLPHVEDSHVGLLVRERQEYVQFRSPHYEREGALVPAACELYMWKWLHKQVDNGTMPRKIHPAYLKVIGISGDPRQMDLGPWVESCKARWSPLACLLRAGIHPQEIPVQYIPYSVLHTKLLLDHWRVPLTDLAPLGVKIDEQQLDLELNWLCNEDSGETLHTIFTTEKEAELRRIRYDKTGLWDPPTVNSNKSRNTSRIRRSENASERATPLLDIHDEYNEDGEWDEENEGEDDFEEDYQDSMMPFRQLSEIPSSPSSSNAPIEKPNSIKIESNIQDEKDINILRNSLIMTSGYRKEFTGLNDILKKKKKIKVNSDGTEEQEEELDISEDWGGMLGFGLSWHDMGLREEFGGGAFDLDDEDEQEEEEALGGSKKRKRGIEKENGEPKSKPRAKKVTVSKVNSKKRSAPSDTSAETGGSTKKKSKKNSKKSVTPQIEEEVQVEVEDTYMEGEEYAV